MLGSFKVCPLFKSTKKPNAYFIPLSLYNTTDKTHKLYLGLHTIKYTDLGLKSLKNNITQLKVGHLKDDK